MTAVGSSPARSSISATIEVVVVLPCAPAIAMPDAQAHQLGQHLGARNHRDVPRARLGDLGVVRGDRRRHDDDVGVADVRARRARCRHGTPSDASRSVMSDRCASDPLTR